jgi:hypothetical protein
MTLKCWTRLFHIAELRSKEERKKRLFRAAEQRGEEKETFHADVSAPSKPLVLGTVIGLRR